MIFYDFEVFRYDWLGVFIDMTEKKQHVIVNNPEELEQLYQANKRDIWVGFNSNHYDQYILKAILCGFDPKKVNDYIIQEGNPGWQYSSLFRKVPLNSYDVMLSLDKGLKWFEGSMGNNIKETSVSFDINRKLTAAEIAETVKYCIHDVEQTIEVFLQRKEEFTGRLELVKLACKGQPLNLSLISRTKPQLTAIILNACRHSDRGDEFDIDFPNTNRVKKYKDVLDWYQNPDNHCYYKQLPGKKQPQKNQYSVMVAGCPHTFAWGGVHGALEKYRGEGYYLMMDVASLYPSLMIQYGLHSRNIADPQTFVDIYHERLDLKKKKDPLQAVLKIVLNSTYGVLKDKNNDLFDPLMSNKVCIYGQILLLDLIEHIEPYAQLIQSNTDGILIKMPQGQNEEEWFNCIDDIAWEWEQRTKLTLEFEEYRKVFQKDVNNYIIVDADGKVKSKGSYVKKLSDLDYGDFPIVNHALIDYMVNGTPVEKFIHSCNHLKEFQMVTKITSKYSTILHGDIPIKEKCIRVFASSKIDDKGVKKVSVRTGKPEKIASSPENCFIFNEDVNDVPVPAKLDRDWYIREAKKRLKAFGVN